MTFWASLSNFKLKKKMEDRVSMQPDAEKLHDEKEAGTASEPQGQEKKESRKECKDCQKLKEEKAKLESDFAAMKAKSDEWEDAYKRKVADFDNYRKRMLKQVEDAGVETGRKLFSEILPVFDNLCRALEASDKNSDFKTLQDGLKITQSQFSSVLEHFGVEAIDAVGKEFDHNFHEALMMEEREDVPHDSTVVEELEKGYLLKGSVIRHSKVKVAKRKKKEDKTEEK